MKTKDTPRLEGCDYFKRSSINYGDRTETLLVYRLKIGRDYTSRFACPRCGRENMFKPGLEVTKRREDGKNREYISVRCRGCSEEYLVERFKVAARGLKRI